MTSKEQIEQKVKDELEPSLAPLRQKLDELVAANDVEGFQVLLVGIHYIMDWAFTEMRLKNPDNDLDTSIN